MNDRVAPLAITNLMISVITTRMTTSIKEKLSRSDRHTNDEFHIMPKRPRNQLHKNLLLS